MTDAAGRGAQDANTARREGGSVAHPGRREDPARRGGGMRSRSAAGLCAVAALALCALMSSGASAYAPPEFTEKASPNTTAAGVLFTITMGAVVLEEHSNGQKVTCTGGTGSGEATSGKVARKVAILLHGCETAGLPCENKAAGSKEIETEVLEGELGDVTATRPGLRLFSESGGPGGEFAKFQCAGGAVVLTERTSVIGYFTGDNALTPPTNVIPPSLGLHFKAAAGFQQYVKLLPPAPLLSAQLQQEICPPCSSVAENLIAAMTIKSFPVGNLGVTE